MLQYLFVSVIYKLKGLKIFILLFTLFCCNIVSLQAQTTYPVPPKNKDMLFYLQRTFNTNTIVFELNRMADNSLDVNNPVVTYWIRYEENNQKTDLTKIQKMLFGLKCIPTNSSNSSFLLINKKIEK